MCCRRQGAGWLHREIHHHFPQGQDTAGCCLLVIDHVRRQEADTGRKLSQPLQDRQYRQAEARERRLDRHLHSGGLAWQGQGSELAASAEGTVLHADAHVSAKDRSPERSVRDPWG